MKTIDVIRKKLLIPFIAVAVIYFSVQFNMTRSDLNATSPYLWMVIIALSLGFVQYFLSDSDFDSLSAYSQSDPDMNSFSTYSDMQVVFVKESKKVLIECSETLVKRYGLKDYVQVLSEDDFSELIHPNDTEKALLGSDNKDYKINPLKEVTFRVKLPGAKQYIHMFRKGYYELDSGPGYLAVDVSNTAYMNEKLRWHEKEKQTLALESQKLMENSRDLIVRLDAEGTILGISRAALDVLGKKRSRIEGKNMFDVNAKVGWVNHSWYEEVLAHHQASCKVHLTKNGKDRHITWNFEAILDDEGEITNILAIGHEVTDYILINQNLKYEKNHDALTGILSQQGLYEKVENESNVEHMVAFFIDIENFSQINDYYGHAIGDRILKDFAKNIRYFERDQCFVSRYSGDEFVIVCMNESARNKGLDNMLAHVNALMKTNYATDDISIELKKNIGYARYPEDTDDRKRLISLASLAMQASAKEKGGVIRRYEPSMSEKLKNNVLIASKLRKAIETDRIAIHHQEVLNVATGRAEYIEALARWHDEELGTVTPHTFIAIAEQSNLVDKLENYLIDKSFESYAMHRSNGSSSIPKLAINLSPSTVIAPHTKQFLDEMLQKHKLNPHDVMLEISENTFVNNIDLCLRRIAEYKAAGFSIALDDFGKDYSSLGILESVDFDMIKIDAIFTRNISKVKNQEIVRMLRKITELSGKELVVEGVETKEQSELLCEMKCHLQQGFHFHYPEKL